MHVTPEVGNVCDGVGHGSIIGRNAFPRSKGKDVPMLSRVTDIYLGAS